jgi:hypothetical protein
VIDGFRATVGEEFVGLLATITADAREPAAPKQD